MADTKYTPRLKGEYNDRIKAVMTKDQWAEASRSTQYAHMSAPETFLAFLAVVTLLLALASCVLVNMVA